MHRWKKGDGSLTRRGSRSGTTLDSWSEESYRRPRGRISQYAAVGIRCHFSTISLMGSESSCSLRVGGKRISGKALLETDHIIFRGIEGKISIPRADVQRVEAEAGDLSVTYSGGTAVFELGPLAERWAEKIRNPRGLLDKLGVKEGCRVAVLGVRDESFLKQLA